MPTLRSLALTAAAALATAGCTATGGGVRPGIDVTRYHLGAPVDRGTVAIEPVASTERISPEYQVYADAVRSELTAMGYASARTGAASEYVVGVSFLRAARGVIEQRPPVTIGLGGGSYGRSGGVSGGVGFGIGGGQRELIVSELWVQLRRRADDTVVWEGRAQAQSVSGAEAGQPRAMAARLARALFKGFPGESGVTITVK